MWCRGGLRRCGSKKLWLNKFALLIHHERAQIPYSDITGMYLAPDIKISGHIHGRPKCQISLKLPCFLIPVATTSNFLRCWTLPDTKYMASYGLLCRIQCAEACDWPEGSYGRIRSLPLWHHGRPVRPHMVAYGSFPYGDVASLWSHTVPSPTAPWPACEVSYGRIRSPPLR